MYQESTLYANASDYLQTIADQVLSGGVDEAMADVMEKFANDSGVACPKELTLLAHSDHPTVTSNGALVYDRAPEVPRLSEQELRSLHSVRASRRRRG